MKLPDEIKTCQAQLPVLARVPLTKLFEFKGLFPQLGGFIFEASSARPPELIKLLTNKRKFIRKTFLVSIKIILYQKFFLGIYEMKNLKIYKK
jgi:hypothetical protein